MAFLTNVKLRIVLVLVLMIVAVHHFLLPMVARQEAQEPNERQAAVWKHSPLAAESTTDGDAPYDYANFDPLHLPPYTEERAKAGFVILTRNSDLHDLRATLRQLEDRFNHRYNYPYVFLNNEPFTEEFKKLTTSIVSGNTSYGLIPHEHWSYPSWIDTNKAAEARMRMKDIIYGDSESYRFMCRYESGFFFRHPLLDQFDYYWRVEPSVEFSCDIRYDPFLLMQKRDLKYGFTISLLEYEETIPTLWKTTRDFMNRHPELVAQPNTLAWVTEDNGEKYNMCHFWSNFEIASVKWLRSEQYMTYFDYLDKSGGFFYERWGDAPVHSLAVAMFLKKEEVHWFEDIGYYHGPFYNCPNTKALNLYCHCNPADSLHLTSHSCTREWLALPDNA